MCGSAHSEGSPTSYDTETNPHYTLICCAQVCDANTDLLNTQYDPSEENRDLLYDSNTAIKQNAISTLTQLQLDPATVGDSLNNVTRTVTATLRAEAEAVDVEADSANIQRRVAENRSQGCRSVRELLQERQREHADRYIECEALKQQERDINERIKQLRTRRGTQDPHFETVNTEYLFSSIHLMPHCCINRKLI